MKSGRPVGGCKGHLAVLIKELGKIVKDRNFIKGRDCIQLLAQLEESFRKYEQAVLDLLSRPTIPSTNDQYLKYSRQLAAARMEVGGLRDLTDYFIDDAFTVSSLRHSQRPAKAKYVTIVSEVVPVSSTSKKLQESRLAENRASLFRRENYDLRGLSDVRSCLINKIWLS